MELWLWKAKGGKRIERNKVYADGFTVDFWEQNSLHMDPEQETKEDRFDDLLESIKKTLCFKQRVLNALNER